jgi:hypothetical protein
MRFLSCEFCLVVKLTIDNDIDIVAELVDLAIASRPSTIWSIWASSLAVNRTM